MLSFCTLFDSNYLSRGLAMYESLRATGVDFHLYVFPFDERSRRIIERLHLEHVTVVPLSEFEDPELLKVKGTRTAGEYCWTSTSSTILYVLERFAVPHCTYVDADVMFTASPATVLEELGQNSVLITEHGYSASYTHLVQLSGLYCVQFITFRNDERGLQVLRWWRERCIEWCYAREEDGKFGDQKYLDDWTTRFKGVHVLRHPGGALAPWNIARFDVERVDSGLTIREKATSQSYPIVVYHFHYLRFYPGGKVDLGDYRLAKPVLEELYLPYLRSLEKAKERILNVESGFDPHGPRPFPSGFDEWQIRMKRRLKLQYNVTALDRLLPVRPH